LIFSCIGELRWGVSFGGFFGLGLLLNQLIICLLVIQYYLIKVKNLDSNTTTLNIIKKITPAMHITTSAAKPAPYFNSVVQGVFILSS
jgi:hypothetical protein